MDKRMWIWFVGIVITFAGAMVGSFFIAGVGLAMMAWAVIRPLPMDKEFYDAVHRDEGLDVMRGWNDDFTDPLPKSWGNVREVRDLPGRKGQQNS